MKQNHEIVTKGVSFNILDPDQKALLEHAMKRKNFSSYIKRLIQRDMDGTLVHQVVQIQQQEEKEVSLDADLMDGLI